MIQQPGTVTVGARDLQQLRDPRLPAGSAATGAPLLRNAAGTLLAKIPCDQSQGEIHRRGTFGQARTFTSQVIDAVRFHAHIDKAVHKGRAAAPMRGCRTALEQSDLDERRDIDTDAPDVPAEIAGQSLGMLIQNRDATDSRQTDRPSRVDETSDTQSVLTAHDTMAFGYVAHPSAAPLLCARSLFGSPHITSDAQVVGTYAG